MNLHGIGCVAGLYPIAGSSPINIRPILLFVACLPLLGADLPDTVPIPEPRPKTDVVPKAENATQNAKAEADKATGTSGQDSKDDQIQQKIEPEAETYVPPPVEKEDPATYKACLSDLKSLGVTFREQPTIDDGSGCGIDRPIIVTALGSVALKPEGTMRCETARQLALWTSKIVTPMLDVAKPGETLAGLDQASTYICRKRNGAATGKISEHAHGNAVDIAGFRFRSGETFSIKPRMQDSTLDGAFQRAITSAACLYFTTVLDPGSDKAHETHLHLDVLKRKAGFRYCW